MFAIEVKNVNLRVKIAGDSWTGDKYDNYGNLKETGKVIADKRGRSPARQINESADKMVEFLGKSLHRKKLGRRMLRAHLDQRNEDARALAERIAYRATLTPVEPQDRTDDLSGVLRGLS